jgi:hypothetical protein
MGIKMNKIKIVLLSLFFISGGVLAEPILDKAKVLAIGEEFKVAMKNKDISVFEKYLYTGSKIIIDMDPANNRGEKEIPYDDYIKLMKMSFDMMGDGIVTDELLSLSINKEKNEAVIEQKTTALIEMMGMKMEDVSINKTTLGIIKGEIKVLSTQDQLVSNSAL